MHLDTLCFQDIDDAHADVWHELIHQTGHEKIHAARKLGGVFTVHNTSSIKPFGNLLPATPLLNLG